jgi:hypothetical protein
MRPSITFTYKPLHIDKVEPMKTVKLASTFIFTSFVSVTATAGCVGTVVMGECSGTEIDGINDNQTGFESSSGTNYEYDLNDLSDRMDYGYDNEAQRRDQMSANPNRQLYQNTGQLGGGIYD